MSSLHPRRTLVVAGSTALLTVGTLLTAAAPASASGTVPPTASSASTPSGASTPSSSSTPAGNTLGSVPDGDPGPTKTPRISLGAPSGVRVTTSASGFTVYATPNCSGMKSCATWVRLLDVGIDLKEISTTNGYYVPWPSTWAKGTTVRSGYAHTYGRNLFGYGYYSTATAALPAITRPADTKGITARLASQDDATRSAVVTGTATPYSSIRRNGAQVATADQWGNWSATVTGLPIGTTTLTFQQWIDNTYKDQASVSVTFTSAELFTGVAGERTVLAAGGTTTVFGQLRATTTVSAPLTGAQVVFTTPAGTTFPADLRTIRGQYRAPGASEWKDFGADALVDGTLSGNRRKATFAWTGAGTGWPLASGTDVRFGIPVENPGTAPGKGQVRITATGRAPQGSFDATAATPVTIAASAVLEPVTVTGPASVSPGTKNTFTGTATPNATYEVVNASGAVIVPGGPFPVDGEGNWTFDRRVPAGSLDFAFAIRQTLNGRTETSELFVLPADTFRPATVTTESATAGTLNAFTGTATPDATYRVLNGAGEQIVDGDPLSVDDRGAWTFEHRIGKNAKQFRFRVEQTVAGRTTTSPVLTVPVG